MRRESCCVDGVSFIGRHHPNLRKPGEGKCNVSSGKRGCVSLRQLHLRQSVCYEPTLPEMDFEYYI